MPIDHFSLVAGLYDRAGKFTPTEPLLGMLSLSPGNLLLDAGGGTGRVAAALRDRVKQVFVADIAPGMLRNSAQKGLATVCAPAEFLPFRSASLDRIFIMDALHHVKDQRQTVHELWRVLAPGGRILIVEPDIRKTLVKLIAIGEKLLLMRSHFLNAEEIASLFADPNRKIEIVKQDYNLFFLAEKVRGI